MEPFDRFLYAMQKAAAAEDVLAADRRARSVISNAPISNAIYDYTFGDYRSELTRGLKNVVSPITTATYQLVPGNSTYAPTAYSLGRSLGGLLKEPFYNPNDLGPYERAVEYLKKSEESELLLREARKLRRRARLVQLQRDQEEDTKKHVENSRYF